jgi:hypothetical protein
LLICPSNSKINVCTDSLTLIHLYNKFINKMLLIIRH